MAGVAPGLIEIVGQLRAESQLLRSPPPSFRQRITDPFPVRDLAEELRPEVRVIHVDSQTIQVRFRAALTPVAHQRQDAKHEIPVVEAIVVGNLRQLEAGLKANLPVIERVGKSREYRRDTVLMPGNGLAADRPRHILEIDGAAATL